MFGNLGSRIARLGAIARGGLINYTAEEEKIFAASRTIGWAVLLAAGVGVAAMVTWSRGLTEPPTANGTLSFIAVMGANLLVGMAAAAAGAVLGFIFGIPRTASSPDQPPAVDAAGKPLPRARSMLSTNTNLERISDWLTTLLIGATLVQIKDIASWVGGLGKNLLKAGDVANDAIVPIIVILFFCLGFLGVYLITRLYVTSAFGQVGIDTGTEAAEADDQAVRAKGTADLNAKLTDALKANTQDSFNAARKAFEGANANDVDRDDPDLNANAARVLIQLFNSPATTDRAKVREELKAAVEKVKPSPATAAALRSEIGVTFKTGDVDLDTELKSKL
ncbi:MAG TPA: hypothetical protein VMM15_43855 [Bradyrhizobium sp.]|nr:hypothetical protein [Bradyrhizobium sp.]